MARSTAKALNVRITDHGAMSGRAQVCFPCLPAGGRERGPTEFEIGMPDILQVGTALR
jgi:hypothetical protein